MNNFRSNGFSLIELLVAVMLAAVLMAGLGGVAGLATSTQDTVHERNELTRQARFAMEQMVQVVSHSGRLLLPLADNPATNWHENVREEKVPASPPEAPSTRATAVLSITLPRYFDLDGDGFADSDNDGDGLIDEDIGGDNNADAAPGIYLIDDNGNGIADDSIAVDPVYDNDEDNVDREEILNGVDDDSDGNIDEDLANDMNSDSNSGVQGVDDDGDGVVDEGNKNDDDEDGKSGEDWYDSLVFYLDNGVLKQRIPVPWDEDASGIVTGADFIVQSLAENVTHFRVERLPPKGKRPLLIDLTLELTSPVTAESVSLHNRVRLGGAL